MTKRKTNLKWSEIKLILNQKSKNELVVLIGVLYNQGEDNRQFVMTRLGVGPDPVTVCKEKILENLCPDIHETIRLAAARKSITDFKKALGRDPKSGELLKLMVYYVEEGTAYANCYGVDYEEYYDSLISMFFKAVDLLSKCGKRERMKYLPRLEKAVKNARDLGWGYYDDISGKLYEEFPE
jgi:hypothetical protein